MMDLTHLSITVGVTLGVVLIVAIGGGRYLLQKEKLSTSSEGFVTARGSQRWYTITASFFSSAMGCWVLTGPPQIGAAYGVLGVIGYACATGLPFVFLAIFGPKLRQLTVEKGYSNVDYVWKTFGKLLWAIYALTAFAVVLIMLIVESISVTTLLVGLLEDVDDVTVQSGHNYSVYQLLLISYCVIGAVVAVPVLYQTLGGARGTFLTDKLQFVSVVVMVVIFSAVIFPAATRELRRIDTEDGVTESSYDSLISMLTAFGSRDGWVALLTLNLSCWFATFLDPGAWTRVYSARTVAEAQFGIGMAGVLLLAPMFIFGLSGVFWMALNPGSDPYSVSLFSMLPLSGRWLSYLGSVLAVCLSSSTIDTLTNSITNTVMAVARSIRTRNVEDKHPFEAENTSVMGSQIQTSPSMAKSVGRVGSITSTTSVTSINVGVARLITLVICAICAVIAMSDPPAVMTLFMVGNMLATITTPPLLLSLYQLTTKRGALCGVLSAAISVSVVGIIYSYQSLFAREMISSAVPTWMSTHWVLAAACGWWVFPVDFGTGVYSLVTFVVVSLISTIMTLLGTMLDKKVRTRFGKQVPETTIQSFVDSEHFSPIDAVDC